MTVIIDTGPLVALLNRRDSYHGWAAEQFGRLRPPLFSCEAVLAEAYPLLGPIAGGCSGLGALIESDRLDLSFAFDRHAGRALRLIAKYADVPMSFVDACLVSLAETVARPVVFTIDADFTVYRMLRNRPLRLILPDSRR